jgi:hypothetical protein
MGEEVEEDRKTVIFLWIRKIIHPVRKFENLSQVIGLHLDSILLEVIWQLGLLQAYICASDTIVFTIAVRV